MINEIVLKNIATYNSIGVPINNLAKINYFFGNNGCGKSILARYLQSVADGTANQFYYDCTQNGYDPNQEEILVFNQEFIERNFKNSDTLKGVFSLNQTNVEIDKKIKENEMTIKDKTEKKGKLEQKNINLTTEKDTLHKKLIDECFRKRDIFKSFAKIKLEYSGSKNSNLSYIEKLLETSDVPKQNLDDLSSIYKKLYEEDLEEINVSIDMTIFNNFVDKQKEISNLLKEIIVGKEDVQLAKMIREFGMKQWVSQGKAFLEKTKDICPFCQKKTIDKDFIEQLNAMFDESFKEKLKKIELEKANYVSKFEVLKKNIQAVSEKYNAHNIVSNLQIELKELFDKNIKTIEEKIKTPNEGKTLEDINTVFRESLLKINPEIERNNALVSTIDEQRKKLIKNIWNYIVLDCKRDIENYKIVDKLKLDEINKNQKLINNLIDEISQIKTRISELRTQTINTKDAVDSINQLLKNSGFMGFEILELEKFEKETQGNNISQYYLSRTTNQSDGSVFNSLSEGERNFISFLYFYQLCLGTTDIQTNSTKKKIIVIDDPVSSMDSQVLFIVSTLVNRLITYRGKSKLDKKEFQNNNISQVFILTHNYYFYKEVAMPKRPICKSQIHYLISKSIKNETSVVERKYKECDDYALMWLSLKEAKKRLSDNNHSENIFLANLFRRILESYANFIGLGNDAWATILIDPDKDSADYYLKSAFISMINDESHKVFPFDSFYFQKIHNETPAKLFAIFESIFNDIGKEHYDMMMSNDSLC